MNDRLRFRLEGADRDHLLVEVLGRSLPQSQDYWDGNWLDCHITVIAGGFRGHFAVSLRSEEFVRLCSGLRNLYASLGTEIQTNVAEFTTLEDQLSIRIVGDGLGHFTAACVAVDHAGIGNRLEFALSFDQSDIPLMLKDVENLVAAFPIRGNPADSRSVPRDGR